MTSDELKTKAAEEAMEVAEASRETEWEKPSFVGDLFMGNLQLRSDPPLPRAVEEDRKPSATSYREARAVPRRERRPGRDRSDRRVSRTRSSRASKSSARGDEDPEGVRRTRIQRDELQPRDRADRDLVRLDGRLALSASVDRRPAAAHAVRHSRAEKEVAAASRRRRDLGVRAHRAGRRLRPGEDGDATACPPLTARAGSSTARSSGARTSRRPSSSSSWRRPRRRS
jgi:hypothetical protein